MRQKTWIRSLTVTILGLLSLSSLYYANRLYQLAPDASVASNLQIPQDGLRTHSEINVKDANFSIENGLLKMSTTVMNSSDLAIFEIAATITAPLYPHLNITYSMHPLKLDPATDSSDLSIHLINGTHVVVLQYYVGHEPVKRSEKNYIYFKYQIGNASDTWFNTTRNIYDDLTGGRVDVNASWRITAIVVGLTSFTQESSKDNSSMLTVFDVNATGLNYCGLKLAVVKSSSIALSWSSFLGLTVSTSFFFVWSTMYLILTRRTNQINGHPS